MVEEEEYTVNIDGQVEPDLLMLVRLLHRKYKTAKKCLPLNSLEDCSAEELVFLTRYVMLVSSVTQCSI